jgi:hypothetical protein
MSKDFGCDITDKFRTACVNAVLVARDPRERSSVGKSGNVRMDPDDNSRLSGLVKTREDDGLGVGEVTCVSVGGTSVCSEDPPEVTDFYFDSA